MTLKFVKIKLLAIMGKVEPLIVALRDKDADVRSSATWALEMIGDVKAVEPLILALDKYVQESTYGRWGRQGMPGRWNH